MANNMFLINLDLFGLIKSEPHMDSLVVDEF